MTCVLELANVTQGGAVWTLTSGEGARCGKENIHGPGCQGDWCLSASGQFGSVLCLKTDIATELCAVLAWSAIRNHDKVGLMLFTDAIETFVPPQKGRRHVLCVIRDVLFPAATAPH